MQTLYFDKEQKKKIQVILKCLALYFSKRKLFKNLQGKEMKEISPHLNAKYCENWSTFYSLICAISFDIKWDHECLLPQEINKFISLLI